jgi:ribosomal-protein-alanine N-acetyltransferase
MNTSKGMIAYEFSHEEVRAVRAHTLAQTNASNRVLQKVGMKFIVEVEDPEEGKVWRWQISRDEYHPA